MHKRESGRSARRAEKRPLFLAFAAGMCYYEKKLSLCPAREHLPLRCVILCEKMTTLRQHTMDNGGT